MRTATAIGYFNDDEEFVALPYKWTICPCCDGEGRSSSHLGEITEDMRDDWSHEEMEGYFAGHYDRDCEHCEGSGKVAEADWSRMTPAQSTAYKLDIQITREMRAEEEMERRFGC